MSSINAAIALVMAWSAGVQDHPPCFTGGNRKSPWARRHGTKNHNKARPRALSKAEAKRRRKQARNTRRKR